MEKRMEYISELAQAVRMEREAEKKLQEARRRVNELVGIASENQQRRRKPSKPEDFARACGL